MKETRIGYAVEVIGIAWGGFEASYDYTFDHEPTVAEIKAKAGDFQSLTEYSITKVTTIREYKHSRLVREERQYDESPVVTL